MPLNRVTLGNASVPIANINLNSSGGIPMSVPDYSLTWSVCGTGLTASGNPFTLMNSSGRVSIYPANNTSNYNFILPSNVGL